MLGKSFFGGEIFDQLDHFETLPRRELQECAEQTQTFDSAACRHTELEMQLSREIEVFHLAPMTSIGLRDPLENRTPQQNLSRRTLGRDARRIGTLNDIQTAAQPVGCNYAKQQPIRQAQSWVLRCFVCITPR
ncbi:conserved protein of unknown function [Bradyrhizobium vignae]|uniref:Uncharacterized protein n=1 Tax=Bradyrhizobium vignae TaxID=1549949 RepID=A0A2U3PY13_9BRAD|nr:conserved protein of unknown function [Bradyrhizobium vignae]